MTPEAVALAERLVALVGSAWSWAGKVVDGDVSKCGDCGETMARYACTPDPDDGPAFDHDWRCGNCGSYDWRRVIDLDHPSNEGHLRLLAQEVCGEPLTLEQGINGWRLDGETYWSTGDTPGQAYAAVIVAAMGETPEERG